MTVEYQRRLEKHYDELKWLYCELYPNGQGRFEELCAAMEQWYKERNKKWKALDRKREKQKDWYKSQKMLGMMLYIDAFADNISGLEKKLDYLKDLGWISSGFPRCISPRLSIRDRIFPIIMISIRCSAICRPWIGCWQRKKCAECTLLWICLLYTSPSPRDTR